jgi:hypothetical protein
MMVVAVFMTNCQVLRTVEVVPRVERLRLHREDQTRLGTGVASPNQANRPSDTLCSDRNPEACGAAANLYHY